MNPPRYMDMDPTVLRQSYWSVRALLANAANARLAGSTARLLRQQDLIVNVARKRGISLTD